MEKPRDGFDWSRARAFLVTAEQGSFSAAARAMGVSQPTVGRQVAALEAELGVTLFERLGTHLQLTQTGTGLLEQVRAMRDAAQQVSLMAAGQSALLEGAVAITASEAVAAHLLPPIVADLRRRHPGIEIELVVSNQTQDLQRREADIAIRNVRPTQPDLFAKKIRDTRAHLYASRDYLERVGPLRVVGDLDRVEIFGFDHSSQMMDMLQSMGLPVQPSQVAIISANHLVQWSLCKHGLGVCFMMEEVGDAEPLVQRVLADLPAIPIPIWLVCHRELHTSRRIRVVFDRIAAGLARTKA